MKNREYITDITVVAFLSKIFIKYPEIIKVKLYGSRAKGNYKPNSDYDLAVFFRQAVDNRHQFRVIAAIKDELSASSLPYLFDIQSYHDISNLALKKHIERVGIVIFEQLYNSPIKQIPKKHHYVPKCYLSRFYAKEDSGRLPLTILEAVKLSIQNLSYEIFETHFFKISEDKINDIFDAIEKNQVIDNNEYCEIIFFAVQQYFRTKKAILSSYETIKIINDDNMRPLPHLRINDPEQFTILNQILMMIIKAQEIIDKNLLLIICKNNAKQSVLTSDQPCYNLEVTDFQNGKLNIYYPISPNTAILITNNTQYQDYYASKQIKQLTEQEVNFYNKFILDNAEQYVYANNRQDLEKLLTNSNNNLQ